MKAIIVDDEPKAIDLLKNYITHFKDIELLATFRNSLKALEYINTNQVDLIFLDIDMPQLSGISLSKIIGPGIKIIFTTAYSEFAAESYEVAATDYLLKPISLERFGKAIYKLLATGNTHQATRKKILIKSGAAVHHVEPEEIYYLQKDGNYITYFLNDRKILARESISEALEQLTEDFIQVHKSYIVNSTKISYIQRDDICVHETLLPIGPSFKEILTKKFK